jgi:hypothetical protein
MRQTVSPTAGSSSAKRKLVGIQYSLEAERSNGKGEGAAQGRPRPLTRSCSRLRLLRR